MTEVKKYNVIYGGRVIHKDQTFEESANILQDYAEKFFQGDQSFDPNLLEMEEI